MSKRVLIIHGWGGSSYPHWQAQLASDLIKEDYIVSFPSLPNKDLPEFSQWKVFIKKEIEHFKPEIVICHSLGNILWFHVVEELNIELEKLMLVAPVSKECSIEELKTFFPYAHPKDLKAKHVVIAASTNDPYLNLEEAYEMQKELDVDIEVFNDAGHINADSGFGRFDYAYEFVKKEYK